jgi:hypothetical protein
MRQYFRTPEPLLIGGSARWRCMHIRLYDQRNVTSSMQDEGVSSKCTLGNFVLFFLTVSLKLALVSACANL